MAVTRPAIDRALLIEGLGRGLRVLESFSDAQPRLTATEAAAATGLTRTAARRHLLSLVHFGYADTDGKHYWLLPSVLRLGRSYLEAARLPRLAQPFLQRFSMQTGQTANLSVLDGHEIVYLARSNAPRVVSIGFHAGARMPAHVVAPGYAIVSTFEPAQLEAWIAVHDWAGFTAHTIVDPDAFRQAVAQTRAAGHRLVEQYLDIGLSGLALPVLDRRGRCVGAVGTTFQSAAFAPPAALAQLLPALQDAAQSMRAVL